MCGGVGDQIVSLKEVIKNPFVYAVADAAAAAF